jgi:hypothetical protein
MPVMDHAGSATYPEDDGKSSYSWGQDIAMVRLNPEVAITRFAKKSIRYGYTLLKVCEVKDIQLH